MDILGVGFPELILIFIIILIVMGPKDMQKAARTLGRWLRRARTSAAWHSLAQLRAEIRHYFQELEYEMGGWEKPEDFNLHPPAWEEGNAPPPSDGMPPGNQTPAPEAPPRPSSGEKAPEAPSTPSTHPPETAL